MRLICCCCNGRSASLYAPIERARAALFNRGEDGSARIVLLKKIDGLRDCTMAAEFERVMRLHALGERVQ
ncbi:hypothetical protein Y032_0190g1233 [Ancylostoma ceylanicum]|uniref:Uncharacterized protein n=1 Tax=Ancylostoma ceylanicum TaxID=53326 RepID=A0A016SPW2_9BILA|nr:hypothetical protein Y032_0190g1233 [Ancylostoma ceylanicum]